MFFEYLNTKYYRLPDQKKLLSSILPWCIMADDGICLIKGGALLCTYEFVAPDLGSSSGSKINAVSMAFNNAVIQLGEGWTVQFELQRKLSNEYPGADFKSLTGYLIDRQREINFSYQKAHYENHYFLSFTYALPSETKMKGLKMVMKSDSDDLNMVKEEIRKFKMETDKIASIIHVYMNIRKLNSEELASYLHSSISLNWQKISLPDESAVFLDKILPSEDLHNSMPLKLGDNYIPIVAVHSFPGKTIPAMFDLLNRADCELRWSTRYICYGQKEALKFTKSVEKSFFGNRKTIGQIAMESIFKIQSVRENQEALSQSQDAAEANIELTSGDFGLGEYGSNIMVWNKNLKLAREDCQYVLGLISSCGFTAKEETLNCLPAFQSMMPGNIYANMRELPCTSGNMSHVIPVSSVWSGLKDNKFMDQICGCSKPLLICGTDYNIPFFLNLNVDGVMHTWISGATGGGKSTLLAAIEAAWIKYPNAKICIFDKGRSARNLTLAVGGNFYEPGRDSISFRPLEDLDTPAGKKNARQFVELCLVEQNVPLNPSIKNAIFRTIENMADLEKERRTLTSFQQYCDYNNPVTHVNDIVEGLSPYYCGGSHAELFDSDSEENIKIEIKPWTCFEMGTLMNMAEDAVAPTLFHLFGELEKKFDGSPYIIILDEAWVFFKNPIFADKILEWLKTLRKSNVGIIFATQEIEDALKSPIASTLASQCPTKIYLPDDEADTELKRDSYKKFGLDDSEIHLLSRMRKQMDYFYKSALGIRRFQLELDPLQLALMTVSAKEHSILDKIESEYGKNSGKDLSLEILKAKKIDYSYLLKGVKGYEA